MRIVLLFCAVAACVSAQSADSQTLQSLLQEVRHLRQDIQGLTLTAQRVQILLYRVQLQDDDVKKAVQRYDQANGKLKDAERAHREAANGLKDAEDKLASLQSPKEREPLQEVAREMKRRADMWTQEESNFRSA